MSHSYRHVPISGNTVAESQKEWKRKARRALRAAERNRFASHDPESSLPVDRRELRGWNIWTGPCDGKGYFRDADAKFMRK